MPKNGKKRFRQRFLKILKDFPTIVKKIMKRLLPLLAFGASLVAIAPAVEPIAYHALATAITRPVPPSVDNRIMVFTAPGTARHVGIAFEHEDYRKIHSFQRLVRRDLSGQPQRDESGTLREQVLFWIGEVPQGMTEIRYRMVIDGLWTVDPLNPSTVYDYRSGMNLSVLNVEYWKTFETETTSGPVTFRYEGASGRIIRLAGNFNNWDPFMYEMIEVAQGRYELSMALPRGTWQYAFFEGSSQVPDLTNHNRVYTRDGRVASIITVP